MLGTIGPAGSSVEQLGRGVAEPFLDVPEALPAAESFPVFLERWNRGGVNVGTWQRTDALSFVLEVGPAVLRLRSGSTHQQHTDPELAGRSIDAGDLVGLDEAESVSAEDLTSDSLRFIAGAGPDGLVPGEVECKTNRGRVTEFSQASRRRMMYRLATLGWDQMPGIPEMVTLTYPAEFPRSGRVVKEHLYAFKRRWFRKWGAYPVGVWKLEFQRRGAPHFHLYVGRPAVPAAEFMAWLSRAWYEVVGSGDEKHLRAGTGLDRQFAARASDVHRLSVYFSKHNAKWGEGKGYQNDVPEWFQDVGRFWGVWGLKPRIEEVELTEGDYLQLRRILAGYRDSGSKRAAEVEVRRVDRSTGEVTTRTVHRRRKAHYSGRAGLFALVQNGPRFSVQLGRWLRSDTPTHRPGRPRPGFALLGLLERSAGNGSTAPPGVSIVVT